MQPARSSHRLRIWTEPDRVVLRIADVTTSGGRLRRRIGDGLRTGLRGWRLRHEPFAVRIWVELSQPHRRLDVDNFAKMLLDTLTGHLWRDDRQVISLAIEKLPAAEDWLTLEARICDTDRDGAALADLLKAIGG